MFKPRRRIAKIKARKGPRLSVLATKRQSTVDQEPWALPIFYLVLALISAGGVVYIFFFSGFFHVQTVTVLENEKVSEEQVRGALKEMLSERHWLVFPGRSLILLDTGQVGETLRKNVALIEDAEVARQLPQTLKIKVKEKQPVAVWQSGGKFYYLDREGLVLGEVDQIPEVNTLPVVIDQNHYPVDVNAKISNPAFLSALTVVAERLPAKLNVGAVQVVIPPLGEDVSPAAVQELRVKTSEGWEIYFDLRRPIETQMAVLLKIMNEEIGPDRGNLHYIDLRVKDKVFYQ
jgi:cell division septal protein FtsQ